MNLFDEFDGIDPTKGEQSIKLTVSLIEFALKGEHDKLDFIKNLSEASALKTLKKANDKLSKGFKNAAEIAYKEYVEHLHYGYDDLPSLLNYRTLRRCEEFYGTERDLAADKLKEFRWYVLSGHVIDTYVLLKERPDEDMFDYRIGTNGK